ncbi:MAG: lipid kinase [Gloeobacterales cyanobacterium]
MGSRALLLVNRHARRGKDDLLQAIQCLQGLGFVLREESTEHPEHLAEVIQRYRDQVDMVIVGGGDGTLNAAVQGLVNTHLPLGILPLGTANDLARTLGIPPSVPEACQIIAGGQLRSIDLGWVNGRYFLNTASMGLSVKITRNLTSEAKRTWGVLAYAATAIQVLLKARPFRAEIRWRAPNSEKEESVQVKTLQIAIGNGLYYGGGMAVAHDADVDDQRLDLYSLEVDHWWEVIFAFPALRKGTQFQLPNVRTIEAQEFEVVTRKPRSINTDGEITTKTPAHFRVIPHALSVFVPKPQESPAS